MKKQANKLAFTLIELLVVITIIGILATGATTVYTSQIQKARDTTRINDLKAVQAGVEQFYQDDGRYPESNSNFSGVTIYTPKLPTDPKTGQSTNNSSFDYLYTVGQDSNSIHFQDYELSTTFENTGTLEGKAETDGGDDDYRLEIGIDLNANKSGNNTKVDGNDISVGTLTCINADSTTNSCATEGTILVIKGN